jgi:hypothetical protein
VVSGSEPISQRKFLIPSAIVGSGGGVVVGISSAPTVVFEVCRKLLRTAVRYYMVIGNAVISAQPIARIGSSPLTILSALPSWRKSD